MCRRRDRFGGKVSPFHEQKNDGQAIRSGLSFRLPVKFRIPHLLLLVALVLCSCRREEDREVHGSTAGPDLPPVGVYHENLKATFIGHESCKSCHEPEYRDWLLSDHHRAMAAATPENVLGDFNDVEFEHFGQKFRFFRKGEEYWINALDAEGKPQDMKVEYTFGHYPLQQYLIPFPGGRLQALQVCWDSRPKEEGGQRWYHLYPEEAVPPEDPLHWTRRHFNWNYMCADCHSTHLDKGFDENTMSYHTLWSEINVSCEACHGPASEHVKWANAMTARSGKATDPNEGDFAELKDYLSSKGLVVSLKEPDEDGSWMWTRNETTGQPERRRQLHSNVQVETCAPCHSHRELLEPVLKQGQPYADTHIPSILREQLYHADGQLKEETYVYGSFEQSKMYHSGVRCSDCHNPHSMKLVAPGNALCIRCHLPDRYDTPKHHFHPVGSTGASCVECHMPTQTYMGVDARRDHSIRIPRPDISEKIGSPDACTKCHTEKNQEWATENFFQWWGRGPRNAHYGEILAAARRGEADSFAPLAALAADLERPALARAAAVETAAHRGPSPELTQVIQGRLSDPNARVRVEALTALLDYPAHQRLEMAGTLLSDPMRSVRTEAARVLAAAHSDLNQAQREAFEKASAEFLARETAIADRGAGHLMRANFYLDLGEKEKAESEFHIAQKVEPEFLPARIRYAETLEGENRIKEAEEQFRAAIPAMMTDSDRGIAHESLSRFLIRLKRYDEGLSEMEAATKLQPESAQTQFFYGVALNSMGRFPEALPYLERAHQLEPRSLEYLTGLATICRDAGKIDLALKYAREALALVPGDPQLRELVRSLGE